MIARRGRKGTKTSKRRKSRLGMKRECDRLFAVAVKARDGWACRACGSHMMPQCAHVVSRRYAATRWSMDNAVCLCSSCHVKYTHRPLEWEAWCEERWPGRLAELKARALAGVSWVDYEAIAESLTGGKYVF